MIIAVAWALNTNYLSIYHWWHQAVFGLKTVHTSSHAGQQKLVTQKQVCRTDHNQQPAFTWRRWCTTVSAAWPGCAPSSRKRTAMTVDAQKVQENGIKHRDDYHHAESRDTAWSRQHIGQHTPVVDHCQQSTMYLSCSTPPSNHLKLWKANGFEILQTTSGCTSFTTHTTTVTLFTNKLISFCSHTQNSAPENAHMNNILMVLQTKEKWK